MNYHYEDIRSAINKAPLWFDEHAVPRYCPFDPKDCANIYADECALVRIQCQACGRDFDVCFSESALTRLKFNLLTQREGQGPGVADRIRDNSIDYGDPPNIGCCPAGPTMSSVPKRVIEYWILMQATHTWVRDQSLEVDIKCDWVDDEDKTP